MEEGFEQPSLDFDSDPRGPSGGYDPIRGVPPVGWVPIENPGWADVDNALYGGPMTLPTQTQKPAQKKGGVEDYLPYAAGALILGTAAFFVIKAKTKNSGEGGNGGTE